MKQEEKALASKNKVLETAMALFSEKGYEETTMQDIMARSGLSKGAIYHYFDGKQEILSTMILAAQTEINDYVAQVAAADCAVGEKVKRLLRYLMEKPGQTVLIQNRWVEKVPYALVGTIRNGNDCIAPVLAEILRQGGRTGELSCGCTQELAEVLLLLFDVWLDPVLVERTEQETAKRLDFLFELLSRFGAPIFQEEDKAAIKKMYAGYCAREGTECAGQ